MVLSTGQPLVEAAEAVIQLPAMSERAEVDIRLLQQPLLVKARALERSHLAHSGAIDVVIDVIRVRRGAPGILDQRRNDCGQECRVPIIVTIQVCDDLAAGLAQAGIPRRGSSLLRQPQIAQPRVTEAVDNRRGVVGAPVVTDQQLPALVLLLDNGTYCIADDRSTVMSRHDHGHQWQ